MNRRSFLKAAASLGITAAVAANLPLIAPPIFNEILAPWRPTPRCKDLSIMTWFDCWCELGDPELREAIAIYTKPTRINLRRGDAYIICAFLTPGGAIHWVAPPMAHIVWDKDTYFESDEPVVVHTNLIPWALGPNNTNECLIIPEPIRDRPRITT